MSIFIEIIKGMIIGIANVIPGLSGGTIAVSMGIYEKLIYTVNNFFKTPIKCLKDIWTYIAGIGLGIVAAVLGITYLFEISPIPTTMLFVGLVLGAVPTIKEHIDEKNISKADIISFIFFMCLIIGMTFMKGSNVAVLDVSIGTYVIMFLLGLLAATTMVVPGVSGSMMLMVLGYYEYIMGTISVFIKAAANFNFTTILDSLIILLPFGIGIVVGIIGTAKLIGWLLEKYKKTVYWGILGLIVASPFPIIINLNLSEINFWIAIISIGAFVVGAYSTLMLTKSQKGE